MEEPDAMQKVCETIGLFNAEYLAVSDISINTHTQLALLAQTTLLKCAGTRVNIRLFLHPCKGGRIVFLSPSEDGGGDGDRHEETNIFLLTILIQFRDNEKERLSDTDDASRQVATAGTPAAGQRQRRGERYNEQHMGGGGHLKPLPPSEY